jgi:hypothetical protein
MDIAGGTPGGCISRGADLNSSAAYELRIEGDSKEWRWAAIAGVLRLTFPELSSPRESHPEALPELYVSLSTHTAPMVETAQRCCSHSASRSGWRSITRSSHFHARVR